MAAQGSAVSSVQAAVRVEAEASRDPGYDRAPDSSILRLNTTDVEVKKSAVVECCKQWLLGSIAEDAWVVSGPDLGKRFSIKFAGLARTAQSHSERAHNALRPERPGQSWKDLQVALDNGTSTKLYVNKDSSPLMLRLALVARVVREVLKTKNLGEDFTIGQPVFHPQKDLASFVRVSAVDIVEITAPSRVLEPSFRVCPKWLAKHGITKESIVTPVLEKLASRTNTTDTSSWV